MLDFDGVPIPLDMSVVVDPEGCIKWAVDNLLPPEFADASFIYQLSASAGLTKLDNELNVHLWFFTNREYSNVEMRTWAKWWNATRQRKIVDPALFNEVQPHCTNEPELLDGLVDPLADRRLGLIRRRRRTVKLYMPTDVEVAAELKSKRERAIKQYNSATKPGKPRKSKEAQSRNDGRTEQEIEREDIGEADQQMEVLSDSAADLLGGVDAINLGQGWRGYLMGIGFEGHIRTQIRAAIGSYFYEYGSRADRGCLKAAIEKTIEESPFLENGEPWSRPRSEAHDYLSARFGGKSNVDEMIADIADRQAESERHAYERCEPSWEVPKLTAEEAYAQIEAAVGQTMLEVLDYKRKINGQQVLEIVFRGAPRVAINCSTGTGKTKAMIAGITELLRADATMRMAIAVPTHKLGKGLADRINTTYGGEVAAEWYGMDAADPLVSDEKMCRLAEAAREVISAGGDLQLLCSRRGQKMEYCPHHPKVAGGNCCGYRRQQQSQVGARTRVWIIPSAMLAAPPPDGLKRTKHGLEGDFDLLVIDEAPWFNLIPNEPVKMPIEWFSPEWWAAQTSSGTEHQKRWVTEVLSKVQSIFARLPRGEIEASEFIAAGLHRSHIQVARRNVWKFKVDLRALVKPGSDRRKLTKALSSAASHNRRVMAVVGALEVIMRHLDGKLASSGIALEEENGIRYLHLRRRSEIDAAWLKAPTLYLDAADTGAIEIAKAWLPELNLKVVARAAAPHMRVTQIVDSPMAYRKFLARGNDDERLAENNRQKLANVVRNRGDAGLVIGPKDLRVAWEETGSLPPGWEIWNFGAIRGRDEARDTPNLVVVSRPLPSPAEVEMIAEMIFARRVERLPKGQRYPMQAVGRLMSDGTGRRAFAPRHPDPFVEAVRFAICEGEVLQAVGRGRGVRRSAEMPLAVLILTNVPIPIPVDQLTAWGDLCVTGPFDVLVARGVVPLDYAGIAAALPQQFANAARVKDWFQYRPNARLRFESIRKSAPVLGYVDMSDFSGILHNDSTMDDSAKLIAYRYRRAGPRQRAVVLVDAAKHADSRAAVEAVLGQVEDFARVEEAPGDVRPDTRAAMDLTSAEMLDQLFGPRSPEPSGLRSFGSKSAS
jgi:hypothetical protein